MCINGRWIVNRYDGRDYFVKCGHCPSCQQEKANRHVKRIQLECKDKNMLPVFVTLTYNNDNVPYIKHSELKSFVDNPYNYPLSVYRGSSTIAALGYDDFLLRDNNRCLTSLYVQNMPYLREKSGDKYIYIKDAIGVLFLRDIQLFIKRLKIRLVRHGYKEYFSYYYASEYGTRYCRPHFHLLFYIHPDFYSQFVSFVCKSWTYADMFGLQSGKYGNERKPIEVARNPAKYVASYINCRSSLPRFLQLAKPFAPCAHFSNGFGCNFKSFSLHSIIKNAERGVITYTEKRVSSGVSTVSEVRIPNYVVNRYFPKFKGYNCLSSDEVVDIVRFPQKIFGCTKFLDIYDFDERVSLYKSLISLQARVKSLGVSLIDWSLSYPRVHALLSSYAIRQSYDYLDLPFEFEKNTFEHFNNILDYYNNHYSHALLDSLPLPCHCVVDPNRFTRNVVLDQNLSIQFTNSVKHHQIKNFYYEKSDF